MTIGSSDIVSIYDDFKYTPFRKITVTLSSEISEISEVVKLADIVHVNTEFSIIFLGALHVKNDNEGNKDSIVFVSFFCCTSYYSILNL